MSIHSNRKIRHFEIIKRRQFCTYSTGDPNHTYKKPLKQKGKKKEYLLIFKASVTHLLLYVMYSQFGKINKGLFWFQKTSSVSAPCWEYQSSSGVPTMRLPATNLSHLTLWLTCSRTGARRTSSSYPVWSSSSLEMTAWMQYSLRISQ